MVYKHHSLCIWWIPVNRWSVGACRLHRRNILTARPLRCHKSTLNVHRFAKMSQSHYALEIHGWTDLRYTWRLHVVQTRSHSEWRGFSCIICPKTFFRSLRSNKDSDPWLQPSLKSWWRINNIPNISSPWAHLENFFTKNVFAFALPPPLPPQVAYWYSQSGLWLLDNTLQPLHNTSYPQGSTSQPTVRSQ